MDLGQYALAATILIGLVNGAILAFDRNYRGFALFLIAVIAGSILGGLQWFGLPSIEIGFAIGVSSSGIYKLAQKVGGQ